MRIKHLVLITLLLLSGIFSNAQPWNKTYFNGTPYLLSPVYCFDSTSGGLMATHNQIWASFFGYLTRFDQDGNVLWTQNIDTVNGYSFYNVADAIKLSGGDYLVNSMVFDTLYGEHYSLVNKYTASGNLLSQVIAPVSNGERAKILPSDNNAYYLISRHDSIATYLDQNQNMAVDEYYRSSVKKIDANNNLVWSYLYSDSLIGLNQYWNGRNGIVPWTSSLFTDGGLIVSRTVDTIPFYSDFGNSILQRIGPGGNLIWEADIHNLLALPVNIKCTVGDIFTTSDSSVIVQCNMANDFTFSQVDGPVILKFNAQGVLIGQIQFPLSQYVVEGTELKNGTYLFYAGWMDTLNNNNHAEGLAFYDKNLNYLSFHPYPFEDNFRDISNLISNHYGGAFCAYTGLGANHIYAVNFDSLLNIYPAQLPGNLYLDNDQNCQPTTGDNDIQYAQVKLTDGSNNNFYSFSGSTGAYNANVPLGSYSVTQPVSGNKQVLCPVGGYNYNFSTPGTYPLSNFYDHYIPNLHDISVAMYPCTFVPGFNSYIDVAVSNEGSVIADTTLTITLDNNTQFNLSIPAPSSVSGNILTYHIQNLQPDSVKHIILDVHVNQNVSLGSLVSFYASIPFNNDATPANNTEVLTSVVVSSFDPNDKSVNRPPVCPPDKDLVYKVRFQNTGTYHARNVVVVDTISSLLDMSTFRLLSSSHSLPAVKWSVGNKLTFTFADIYLPDSNTNEPASHGEFIYSIRPKTTVNYGDTINNTAHIYFDFNEAVVTNTTSNIIGWPTFVNALTADEHIVVYPNPVSGVLTVLSHGFDSYEINNIIGQAMETGRIKAEKTLIDASQLPPGIYYIRLSGQSGKATQKFQKL